MEYERYTFFLKSYISIFFFLAFGLVPSSDKNNIVGVLLFMKIIAIKIYTIIKSLENKLYQEKIKNITIYIQKEIL